MFNFRNLVLDNKFVICFYLDYINVLNYDSVGIVSDSKISIFSSFVEIIIYGSNLVLSKMVDNEILIKGSFSKIEYR